MERVKVTIWNEYIHEKEDSEVARIYPKGIHEAIVEYLKDREDLEVSVATFEESEHGLTEDRLRSTDVLVWWGHRAHEKVSDKVVDRVYHRVVSEGMGLIVLHSAHLSKIFRRLMGTSCRLKWREAGERERVWVVSPWHPIADGLGEYFEIEHSEMYGEPFDIPPPDQLVFISWFKGGEVFRSGCCFYRGMGRIFYFSPGHESYPIYYDPNVRRVIYNAILWAKPVRRGSPVFGRAEPLEKL
ncbi:MAG: ThuA domain-containing protein [Candidatus Bathyarchaeia archaeon]